MKVKHLTIVKALALMYAGYAHAAGTSVLEPVVVVGQSQSKPEAVKIGAEELKRTAAQNIDDTVLYTPGVDVRSDNMQVGHRGYVIRGMGDNRIAMTIDGVPLPELHADMARPNSAPTPSVNRDLVEMDTLKTVEIRKSGDGVEQGNGALGGSVNMSTYSPEDLVSPEKPWHLGVKYGYRSTYKSHGVSATTAMMNGPFAGMLILTRRNSHEAENYAENDDAGARRTISNKQDVGQNNILFKANVSGEHHRLETIFERMSRDTHTRRLDRMRPHLDSSTTDDDYVRRRLSVAYRYLPSDSWLGEAAVRAYRQNLSVANDTDSLGKQTTYYRNDYLQKFKGIRADMKGSVLTGNITQQFALGTEYRQTETSRLLDQEMIGTGPGTITNPRTENRYFPPSERKTVSLYAKNDLVWPGKTTLGFGLRYEREKTEFDVDAAYLGSVLNKSLIDKPMKTHALLPSVYLSVPLADAWTASASYKRGFRSPGVDAQGAGMDRGTYRVRPNPDLKPEKSDNFDVGLRYRGGKLNVQLTGFYARFKDFINTEMKTNYSPGYKFDVLYSNLDKAKTYGAEIAADWKLTDAWKLSGSMAWMRGKNESDGKPLGSAYPLNGVLGLDYGKEKWSVGTRFRWSKKQTRVADDTHFKAPGYGVWDMTASFHPSKHAELNVGVYNIGNRKYWRSADVIGVKNNLLVDRYTQPGRNFSVGLNVKF
ncbi:TonB-dependent hemoglobin/transferrin/lactoferrin family receptor [Neisseria weaveri]|uniref:TonB-dependent hemoglobin/transferrin/lactoferrin family receptor n=1 Tax=Neisseria weaveri TaxID=28091 RepID=UPI0007C9C8B3|nr:TonB-dependent hemoglobin/transferrin/lactoferrin family receptor [Neisseria weaveri]SAY51768.1 hemoglobin-haptoglobin-utilization protein [Neisseria weaveri]